jgi:hypothetical protein
LVQHVQTPNTGTTGGGTPTTFKIPLPNETLAGNTIIAWVTAGQAASQSVSCTDDKSNSYTLRQSDAGVSGGQGMWMFVCEAATAGATYVTFTFTVGTTNFAGGVAEYYNVAASSVYETGHAAHTSGAPTTSWAAGSFTTSNSGDLIYQAAVVSGNTNSMGAFSAGTSGLHLEAADRADGSACQAGNQGSAGAINPTITAASNDYVSCAVALKSGSSGTAPSITPRVVHLQHSSPQTTSSSFTLQFPCSGDTLHISYVSGQTSTTGDISSLSDSKSNTWTQPPHSPVSNGQGQGFYAKAAVTDYALTITFTLTGAPSNAAQDAIFYDLIGVDQSSPVMTDAATTGNQASGPANLTTVTVTPTAAAGLAIFVGDQDWDTMLDSVTDGNGHKPLWNEPTWGGQNEGGSPSGAGDVFTLDAMAACMRVTDTNAITLICQESAYGAALTWGAYGIIYKQAGAAAAPVPRDLPHSALQQSFIAS